MTYNNRIISALYKIVGVSGSHLSANTQASRLSEIQKIASDLLKTMDTPEDTIECPFCHILSFKSEFKPNCVSGCPECPHCGYEGTDENQAAWNAQFASPGNLESYRGCFKDGHTSEEADKTFFSLSPILGLPLVIIWEYCDMWGTNGDNDIVVMKDGKIFECPLKIIQFLYEGIGKVEDLVSLSAGKPCYENKIPIGITPFNYAWNYQPNMVWNRFSHTFEKA